MKVEGGSRAQECSHNDKIKFRGSDLCVEREGILFTRLVYNFAEKIIFTISFKCTKGFTSPDSEG